MASVSRWCPQCTEPQGGPGPHSARTSDWSPPPQVQGLQGAGVCIWATGSCTHTSGRTSPAHRGPCQSDESARALRPGTKLWRHLQARRRAGAPAPDQGFASHTLQGGLTAHLLLSHSKACLATGRGQEDQLPLACPQPLGRHPTSPLPAVRGGLPCLAFTLGRSHTRGSCPGDTRQHLEQLRSVPVGSSSAHGGQAGEGGVQAAHWVKGPLAGRWGVGKRQGERQGQRETETGREREIDRD